jgi:nucleotide-binding universal stress UspA family protein
MLGAEVELLHVLERTPDAIRTDLSGSVGLGDSATLLQRLMQLDESRGALRMERGRAILESAAARVSAAGGRISGMRLRTGGLVDSVKESEDGVRLVVLGRRGERADMAKAHFGGSAEQVIRASKLSVLVVPPIYKSIQNVLLAFDGSQCAINAAEFLVSEPGFHSMKLHIIMAGNTQNTEKSLAFARSRFAEWNGVCTFSHLPGEPEAVLNDYLSCAGMDLLIMGAYGDRPVRALTIGNTATAMARTCSAPVLLIR